MFNLIGSEAKVSKSNLGLTSLAFSVLLSMAGVTPTFAAGECDNAGSLYTRTLVTYQATLNPTNEQYKQLVESRKISDMQIKECVRIINQEFKNTVKNINTQFSSGSKSQGKKLSQSTNKNSQISSAIILRDERIKALEPLPPLPQKPIKQKQRNK
jgi:hypothetical protein